MQHQTFRITYDGPALDANEVEIRELAPALHVVVENETLEIELPVLAIYETVDQSQAHYFLVPAELDEEVVEARYTANVRIVRIEFNEENKWRFTDGDHTFYASILDDAFLRKIATDEVSFSRGDVLRVRVRRRQSIGDQIKSTYFIDEVLEHRTAYRQIRLPFADGAQVPPAGPISPH